MQLLDYWLPICNGNNDDTLNQCIENPMQKSFALEREYHNIIGMHCLNLLQVNKVKLHWVQMKDRDCMFRLYLCNICAKQEGMRYQIVRSK